MTTLMLNTFYSCLKLKIFRRSWTPPLYSINKILDQYRPQKLPSGGQQAKYFQVSGSSDEL